MRHIARPRPSRGIKPTQRQDREYRTGYFMKKLLYNAPEPPKTMCLRRRLRYAADCAHRNILAHNRERNVLPSPPQTRRFVAKGL